STTVIYTLSLHDALPISLLFNFFVNSILLKIRIELLQFYSFRIVFSVFSGNISAGTWNRSRLLLGTLQYNLDSVTFLCHDFSLRSEEHTSELQSRENLVC